MMGSTGLQEGEMCSILGVKFATVSRWEASDGIRNHDPIASESCER